MSKSLAVSRRVVRGRVTKRRAVGRLTQRVGGARFDHAKMVAALDKRDSRSQRVAYYLDWCAAELPLQYQPFNTIVQEIMAYARLPRMDAQEVLAVRTNMGAVRRILQRTYQRDLDIGGGGARATVSDEDVAGVVLPKKVKRLRSAKNAVLSTHSLIDPGAVRDPRILVYLNKSVREVIKMIGSEDFDRKLLPPSGEK